MALKLKWLLLCCYVLAGGVVMACSQTEPKHTRSDVFAPSGIMAEFGSPQPPAPMSELEVK